MLIVLAVISTSSPAAARSAVARPVTAALAPLVALRRQSGPAVRHEAPVDAPVVDLFRPPTSPYGPGNRGWEYATAPGTPVRASAAGTVVFAGQVGPLSAVTVRHADGLLTSYSLLVAVSVTSGDPVVGGGVLGRSSDRMHFGVRQGETYLDPAVVLTPVVPVARRPRLVPFGS